MYNNHPLYYITVTDDHTPAEKDMSTSTSTSLELFEAQLEIASLRERVLALETTLATVQKTLSQLVKRYRSDKLLNLNH